MDDQAYPPELCLFEPPPQEASLQKLQYVEYRPNSQLNSGPLTFVINPTANQYIDLKRTRLHIKAKLVKGDGSAPAVTENVAPCNLILQSLFGQVEVQMQQQVVSNCQLYGYKAYIETVLDNDKSVKETKLQMQGYYKDDAGVMENMSKDPEIFNQGFVDRMGLFSSGRIVDLEGPIFSDIAQQSRLILNGVEIQIKMWPAKDEFLMMSKVEGANYRIQLVEAYLRVCKITPIPAVMLAHSEIIKEKPALYPYSRTQMKAYQLNQGQYSFQLEDVFLSDVPVDIVLGLVNAGSFNGSYDTNPYDFQNYNLGSLAVYLDDESVPSKPLKMNYGQKNWITAYNTLFKTYAEEGNDISRVDYPYGYTLYMFRLIPDHLPPFMSSLTRGNVKIQGTFDTPLPENVTLLVYAKFPSMMTVDSARNIQI